MNKKTNRTQENINKNSRQNEPYITAHAYQRLRERNGWNKKTADRMLEKIYTLKIEEDGRKKEQMLAVLNYEGSYTNVILYGDILYLFKGNALVTILWQNHMDVAANNKKKKNAKRGDYEVRNYYQYEI